MGIECRQLSAETVGWPRIKTMLAGMGRPRLRLRVGCEVCTGVEGDTAADLRHTG